jgi:hypothetical protein
MTMKASTRKTRVATAIGALALVATGALATAPALVAATATPATTVSHGMTPNDIDWPYK